MSSSSSQLPTSGKQDNSRSGSLSGGMASFSWPILEAMLQEDLKALEGSRFYDQAKNSTLWNMEFGDLDTMKQKYLDIKNMINDYLSRLSDETYAEGEIYRQAEAQSKIGINTDLTGSVASGNGFVSGAGEGAAPYTGAELTTHQMPLSDRFFEGVGKIASLGQTVGSLFTGVSSAVEAVRGLHLRSDQMVGEAISKAMGLSDDLIDKYSGMSDDDIVGAIKNTIFGDGVKPGALQGFSRRQLSKAAKAFDTYISNRVAGNKYKTGVQQSGADLSAATIANQSGFHDVAVADSSGIYDVEGEIFQTQVEGAKELAKADVQLAVAKANAEKAEAEFETEFHETADAALAAREQNERNKASIEKSMYDADYYGASSGADMSRNDRALSDLEVRKDRALTKIAEANEKVVEAENRGEVIYAEQKSKMISSMNDKKWWLPKFADKSKLKYMSDARKGGSSSSSGSGFLGDVAKSVFLKGKK